MYRSFSGQAMADITLLSRQSTIVVKVRRNPQAAGKIYRRRLSETSHDQMDATCLNGLKPVYASSRYGGLVRSSHSRRRFASSKSGFLNP